MKDLLLITPPFTQLNTPYPATAYLKGFLNTKNISSYQIDLGIEVILEIFSKKGVTQIFNVKPENLSENTQRIFALKEEYIKTIDEVIAFLQNKKPTLARQICSMNFLPEASRFNQLDDMEYAFGNMGLQDKAKHLATLYLEDLSDYIIENIDATIIAQKPKMRPYIDDMRKNIADALKIDVDRVNVKATTEEGLGFTGEGLGISAQAVCLLNERK